MRITDENLEKVIEAGKFAPEGEWVYCESMDRRRGSILVGGRTLCGYDPASNWAKTPSGNSDKFQFLAVAGEHAVLMAHDLREARTLLKETAEYIRASISWHYAAMNKGYLARDAIEKDTMLLRLEAFLAEHNGEKNENNLG